MPCYVNLFTGANRVGGKAYAYIFDHVPAAWKKDGAVATHDGIAVRVRRSGTPGQRYLGDCCLPLAKPPGPKTAIRVSPMSTERLAEMMTNMWTNFAKTGNPSIEGVIDWPAWDEAKDQYLYITEIAGGEVGVLEGRAEVKGGNQCH